MGCKISSFSSDSSRLTDEEDDGSSKVMVVDSNGALHEFASRVTAAEAVAQAGCSGAALSSSDKIFFDAFPPALPPGKELEAGQLYFMFEPAELRRRVTGADMAALATRASAALHRAAEKQGKRLWRPRVMPVEALDGGGGGGEGMVRRGLEKRKAGRGLTLKGRAQAGSFRRALNTVHEGDEE